MTGKFEFDLSQDAKIKVIGIGGAGNNAINNMIASGLTGVSFIAANTDLQDLDSSPAEVKMQLGAERTKGLGCGADPEVGREAAMEDVERIQDMMRDADMVFITAGMGGGTGTGGAPVVAEALRQLENPPLTVAVVTKPFTFEGPRRMRQAKAGIEALTEHADTIITIPNERLRTIAPRGANVAESFKLADDVLLQAVKGVSDIILIKGLVNVDFMDVRAVMASKGQALMGTGIASGPDRATVAAQQAISSPLLEDLSIEGAQGILINICASENNLSLDEVYDACSMIKEAACAEDDDENVIFGVGWDDNLGDDLRITVIATGIGRQKKLEVVPEKNVEVPNIDAAAKPGSPLDVPTNIRKTAMGGGREPYRPRYNKYDIAHGDLDEKDLDTPTFMRIKAD